MPLRLSVTQVIAAILLVSFAVGMAGCSAKPTPVTKEEQANWKGGPMPADFHPNVAGGPPPAAPASAAPAAPAAPK